MQRLFSVLVWNDQLIQYEYRLELDPCSCSRLKRVSTFFCSALIPRWSKNFMASGAVSTYLSLSHGLGKTTIVGPRGLRDYTRWRNFV